MAEEGGGGHAYIPSLADRLLLASFVAAHPSFICTVWARMVQGYTHTHTHTRMDTYSRTHARTQPTEAYYSIADLPHASLFFFCVSFQQCCISITLENTSSLFWRCRFMHCIALLLHCCILDYSFLFTLFFYFFSCFFFWGTSSVYVLYTGYPIPLPLPPYLVFLLFL